MAASKAKEAEGSAPKEAQDKKKAPPAELSPEDALLKAQLETYVLRAADGDAGVQRLALESLRKEIKSATRCVPA